MIITVLLAPDGSPIAIMHGRQSLDAFCEDLDETQWPDVQGSEVIGYDLHEDGYTLAPGYHLEHHDLADLLARPTAEELQAATTERDRLRVVVDELAQRGADGFRVSLGHKEPGRMVIAVTGPTDQEMNLAQLIVGLFKAAEATQAAVDGEE